MKDYEYFLNVKSLDSKNWLQMCEVLCNNAYCEIARIKSLSQTFSDEAVYVYANAVLRDIDALKTICAGGNENA